MGWEVCALMKYVKFVSLTQILKNIKNSYLNSFTPFQLLEERESRYFSHSIHLKNYSWAVFSLQAGQKK